MRRTILLLIFVICLICSCREDDVQVRIADNDNFELHLDLHRNSANQFIIASNDEGEIVFDTLLSNFEGVKMIDIPQDEKLNITYGYEEDRRSFSINTYAQVKSGFLLKNVRKDCSLSLFDKYSRWHNIELTIKNSPEIDSVFSSFLRFYETNNTTIADGKVVIRGRFRENFDQIITLKTKSNSFAYQSYLLPFDHLNREQDTIYHEVDFNEFQDSKIEYVNLKFNTSWEVDITGVKSAEKYIEFLNKSNYLNTYRQSIRFFTLENLKVDQYLLNVRHGIHIEGLFYEFRKFESEIPVELSFYEPHVKINNKSPSSYDISLDESTNLVLLEYHFRYNNVGSTWKIYNYGKSQISADLPTIPHYILEEYPIISEIIEFPNIFIVRSYEVEDFTEAEFSAENVDRNIDCNEIQRHSITESF